MRDKKAADELKAKQASEQALRDKKAADELKQAADELKAQQAAEQAAEKQAAEKQAAEKQAAEKQDELKKLSQDALSLIPQKNVKYEKKNGYGSGGDLFELYEGVIYNGVPKVIIRMPELYESGAKYLIQNEDFTNDTLAQHDIIKQVANTEFNKGAPVHKSYTKSEFYKKLLKNYLNTEKKIETKIETVKNIIAEIKTNAKSNAKTNAKSNAKTNAADAQLDTANRLATPRITVELNPIIAKTPQAAPVTVTKKTQAAPVTVAKKNQLAPVTVAKLTTQPNQAAATKLAPAPVTKKNQAATAVQLSKVTPRAKADLEINEQIKLDAARKSIKNTFAFKPNATKAAADRAADRVIEESKARAVTVEKTEKTEKARYSSRGGRRTRRKSRV